VPPTSRRQQRFVFAQAHKGVAWAQKWVAEGKMKVQKKPTRRKRRLPKAH
jgi:hypothetical protein